MSLLAAAAAAGGCERPAPTVFELAPGPRMLTLETYDGSGQVVHPDVIRVESDPENPFWMVATPYPFSDEKVENPSIWRSRDGLHWEEPAARVNPIASRPGADHNSDPDLIRRNGQFVVHYLETQRREYRRDELHFQRLRVAVSPDGTAWKVAPPVLHWDLDRDSFYVSPSLVETPSGWRLYLVRTGGGRDDPTSASEGAPRTGGEVVWLPSADLREFGAPAGVLEHGLDAMVPWHVDVFAVEGGWVALVCGSRPDLDGEFALWIGASPDLDRWTFRPEPLLQPGPGLLDTDIVYRSTGLVAEGRLAVWFSARTRVGRWFLGIATWKDDVVRSLLASSSPRDR